MGRQVTDHATSYWWRAVEPEGARAYVHAAWRASGTPRCGSAGTLLGGPPAAVVPAGVDFLDVDPDVCKRCLALAEQHPQLVL